MPEPLNQSTGDPTVSQTNENNMSQRIQSRLSEDPLFLAGISFMTGYLITSGHSDRVVKTGRKVFSAFGKFVFQSVHESFDRKRGEIRA